MNVTPHQKFESSPFPSCLTSSLPWLQITFWKKVSLITFRQILPKSLSVVHIFNFIITNYLKKFPGIKSLSTKQCSAELSPWFISYVSPFYKKRITSFHLPCCPYHVWTVLPLPPNLPFGWESVNGRRILPSSKKRLISHTRKIPLTK